MTDGGSDWTIAKNELIKVMNGLGFPDEFGYEIAKELGSPQAIRHMTSYLSQARPKDPETIVDEMLAIKSQIDSWKKKKESERASSKYNMILRHGIDRE
jgi:hypothetical protein